ncbi:hypothetical protein CLAFUW4_02618 [Fulvia fulva]|uniref:Uncharacterized protein n=1 Tax=Passalora fulva TaxID=5499 RepID=A0A9Q8L9P0_PASFU|nr:uncharacterized protein CLAFUR5_02606 [Fulvia fulva]KAK4631289.1 hypothetical protein CLAFUR4_02613 [Fulvia fulva]KAK4633910.1 hypothetical protein CLAFUR0_02615 [Fulvia fulva]UJO13506.1 hypothetical protein CLAFUR5_02606 [Fulvia fulva]WPV11588.1 hypothetical protein CLAFUW4_02618 [Fulvia fulva]WPV26387.1 hypothetical protein CLAFUW7_02618 [Fulvia fulva]
MPAIPPPKHDNISQAPLTLPIRRHKFDTPKLRLQLNDLAHEGSSNFLSNIKGNEDLEEQVQNVLNLLYTPESKRPGTRSVTFIIRDAGGVAYTTGIDLDDDHKEIHLNLGYIKNKPRYELLGVICHELVHCFQWNAEGTCPGGLIEGIADWVRLRAGLAAKHWKQVADGRWDAGYQQTGYFLEWLEHNFGPGTVRSINDCLRNCKYDEEKVFGSCCEGHKVDDLWKDYGDDLKKKKKREDEKAAKKTEDVEREEEHER